MSANGAKKVEGRDAAPKPKFKTGQVVMQVKFEFGEFFYRGTRKDFFAEHMVRPLSPSELAGEAEPRSGEDSNGKL
jgi:hypothetical protein